MNHEKESVQIFLCSVYPGFGYGGCIFDTGGVGYIGESCEIPVLFGHWYFRVWCHQDYLSGH